MAEVKKSDFIYFQNEFLQDIKNLDIKFNEKISQLVKTFQNQKLVTDQKFEMYNDKISSLLTLMETNAEYQKLKTDIENFKKHISQNQMTNTNKLYYLQKDLSDACFRYDNLFSSLISVPGLIGKGCKYADVKNFYQLTDKKISELQNFRDKNNMDLDKYKKKLETLIGQFKLQIDNSQNKYFSFCNEKITETKNKIDEQFNFIDEKISKMRMDNGKHSYDLIQKTEELRTKINTIDNISNEVNNKLTEEMSKYQKYNDELVKIFDSQKEEFKIIKIRFTELSEFIKDVRFMRNLNSYSKLNNNKEFDSVAFLKNSKQLSKKLNFDKNQKITLEEENKYINNNDNENTITNTINDDKNNNNNDCKENDNNSINVDNNTNIDNNKMDENKNDLKRYNIKKNYKGKDASTNINFNSTYNNNLNITKNNNIINNNYTINSSIKNNSNTNSNSISANKSRNFKTIYKEGVKTDKNQNKKFDYLKTEESISNNQNKPKSLFIRTQSQFCLHDQIQSPTIRTKVQQHTQNNFYPKNKKINTISLFNGEGRSARVHSKFKKIWEKEKKLEFDEILKILANDNIYDNLIHIEAYKYLNNKIIKSDEKIIELTNMTKINFEKIYKKIHLYIELTNSLLIKIKREKSKPVRNSNSPVKIYTHSEFNIPLIKSVDKKNLINNNNFDITDKNKIRIQNLENNTLLNIQDRNKKISSGKILSVIEPYLIKKFKSNNK